MKIRKVLGTKIVMKKESGNTKTNSGLYIPETISDDVVRGEIKLIDPSGVLVDGETRVGDRISIGDMVVARSDYSVEVDDDLWGKCVVIDANNVLCIFEDD